MSSETSMHEPRADIGAAALEASGAEPVPGAAVPRLELDPRVWRELFSLTRKEAEDKRLLRRLLVDWCAFRGLDAGLYTEAEDGYRLQVQSGEATFPERLRRDELAELAEWLAVELPQGLLLCSRRDGAEAPQPSSAGLLLLAAGARICELKRRIEKQSFQAKFRGVELEALFDVGLAIASTLDLEELCDEVLMRAVSLLDARRGALYLLDDGHYRLTGRSAGEALDMFSCDDIDLAELENGTVQGPDGWLPGAVHLLAVPVEIESDPRGLLVVADKESRHGVGPFHPTDRRTLSLFANQAAIALENAKLHKLALEKERLEREMELAADIQQQLLPKTMPEIPGFEVLGWNRPARHVGGDYFDFQSLEDSGWGLVVGDVTGKGMPAALLVSTLHSALRVLLDRMEVGPPLIERLNRHIFESSSPNKFITMLLAALDTGSSRLTYLNAGHNPGILVRRDGAVEQMVSAGLPLGLLPRCEYGARTLDLEEGDLVCLYSDGITECESDDEEEFGLERLTELLREHREESLGRLLDRIDRAVTDFAHGRPQGDDQTVVFLRRCRS